MYTSSQKGNDKDGQNVVLENSGARELRVARCLDAPQKEVKVHSTAMTVSTASHTSQLLRDGALIVVTTRNGR